MEIKSNNIYNTDCIDLMSNMHEESVDLIITDPPRECLKRVSGGLT